MGWEMQKEHKSHPDTSGSSRPASPTQHPVTSTQRWGRVNTASPFLAISSQFLVFSVQTSRSPVMTNAQVLLFRVVSFQAFLYCGNKKHNLDMPCFINHSLNLHLPVSLCRKATLALFQYPSESNTRDTCPTCHYHQDSKTAGTQEKIQVLILLPHHRASLSLCLLCFSSFYNLPPTPGGFFVPFFLFPYHFLVGKANTCLGAKPAGRKFQCSFTIRTFGKALLFPDF